MLTAITNIFMSSSLLNSPVIPSDILVNANESMAEFVDEIFKILAEPISTENQLITEPKLNAYKTHTQWKKKIFF